MTNRQLFRRRDRSLVRRTVRRAVRCRWRAPDYLALSLRACQRLLRCNRQLARLVPEFFDPVIVDRLARERAENLRWRAEWEPALRKVYGESADPEPEPDLLPPLPSPRVQRRVDALLAERQQWLTLGTLNLRRFHERRPQKVASLGQLARLLWAAVQLGRWAAGIPDHPEPPTPAAPDPWADLARIYPEPPAPSPAAPLPDNVSGQAGATVPSADTVSGADATGVSAPPTSVPLADTPAPARVGRRDVWSSVARQLRRQAGLR